MVKFCGIEVLTLGSRGCRLFEGGDVEAVEVCPLTAAKARKEGEAGREETIINERLRLPLNHQDRPGALVWR